MQSSTNQRLLVHAVPSFITRRRGAGNWKDVQSRILLWPNLGIPVCVLEFDQICESLIEKFPLEATDVLIEYSWWPDLIERLRQRNHFLRVHVRTHNAETLQHLHRAEMGWLKPYQSARAVYGAARLLIRDMRNRALADTLLGISKWDDCHYWSRLPGRSLIQYLPYYCPWPFLDNPEPLLDWNRRRGAVLCLPGANDPISASIISGFRRFASIATRKNSPISNWTFELSSGLIGVRGVDMDQPITTLKPVSDIWKMLCQVRAVAVLGRLGYGMKTTIVDAVAAGCHVLVHPRLLRRLPPECR